MDLIALSAELRDAERDARNALDRGCEEDLTSIARFLDRPLREAKEALEAKLNALGSLDPVLHRNIVADLVDETALHCARNVFDNANIRFRARFGMYASALAGAEQHFFDTTKEVLGECSIRPRVQRRITLPHIEFDDSAAIAVEHDVSTATIDRWIDGLDRYLRSALKREVNRARWMLLNRGASSLARTRVALRLAAQGRRLAL